MELVLLLRVLVSIASITLLVTSCNGGKFSESTSLLNFIRAVDPENVLRIERNRIVSDPCSYKWKGVNCNPGGTTVIEIRLVNLNLTGILDVESICKLPNLEVLSLAGNSIQGTIPDSIWKCKSLTYLDLSRNSLSGSIPTALTKLKSLRRLDISQNHLTGRITNCRSSKRSFSCLQNGLITQDLKQNRANLSAFQENVPRKALSESSPDTNPETEHHKLHTKRGLWILLGIGIVILVLVLLFMITRAVKRARDKKILKALANTPSKTPPIKAADKVQPQERRTELVFFVELEERFKLEDLLEATAGLRTKGLCSSLYIVQLKNNAIFAVKRLKKLRVSFQVFGQTMRKIGNLKHPNILPLVAYNSTKEEKLLIYKYQRNENLLTLLANYTEGKRIFSWKLRLSIAAGIAEGLNFIYHGPDNDEIIPHGNIKLSNILLNDDEEPLISEYGYSRFLDPSKDCLFKSKGYTAPEKSLTEKSDVFSFGVVLLELLTGKIVENNGIDLPRWVKSVVREEWTVEVFDKEVAEIEMYAIPMLNVALKCVSHRPRERPTIAEVREKIAEVVSSLEDLSPSSMASSEFSQLVSIPSVTPDTLSTRGIKIKPVKGAHYGRVL
ncbi:putative inactive receptor kinase [Abeliophyllum distichum]|uniref:Inactive receptor kinase n=1 Tax=Abeliophyllum distichum TaxID=126358 RepID=A0ABD1UFG9_9LAMI